MAREGKYLLITKRPSLKSTRRYAGDNIRNKHTHFVALDGDREVGWCDMIPYQLFTIRHAANLGMGLLKEYRGQGIGFHLLQIALKRARAKGVEVIYLDVYQSNKKAIRLYQKFNFKTDGIRKKPGGIRADTKTSFLCLSSCAPRLWFSYRAAE